jgi:hypothetical protein
MRKKCATETPLVKDAASPVAAMTVTVESFPMPKGTTWTNAQKICTNNGQLLCSNKEVCPDGPKTTPVWGKIKTAGETPTQEKFMRGSDVWVATRGTTNEWTSVGNFDPTNRLCRTHEDSQGSQPGWGQGTGNYNFRQEVLCCSSNKAAAAENVSRTQKDLASAVKQAIIARKLHITTELENADVVEKNAIRHYESDTAQKKEECSGQMKDLEGELAILNFAREKVASLKSRPQTTQPLYKRSTD